MPANSSYAFSAGQILTAVDLNAVFAQTVAFAADSSNANTGTLPEVRLPYRMNQDVRSNSSVEFVDVVLTGNLTVSGTTTFVNTSVLDVKDKNITIAKGSANSFVANGAGITVDGVGVGITYYDASNTFNFDTPIRVGNSTVNAILTSNTLTVNGSITLNSQFTVNTTGVYHSGTVNAATIKTTSVTMNTTAITVGSNAYINTTSHFMGNSTVYVNVTAGAINVNGAFIANNTGAYHSGTVNAASHTIGTTFVANTTGAYHTGTINAASFTIGTDLITNTTGVFHTGTINAASFTTTNITANTVGIYPLSNTAGNVLGTVSRRWTIYANTIATSGLLTAAADLNVTGTANVSSTLNVGSNVNLTTTQLSVGNSTVNSTVTSSNISTQSLSVNSLIVTSSITIGNSSTNTTSFDVGNSTITDTSVTTDNLNVVGLSNTANLYVSTYANIASQAAVNTSGVYVKNLVNTASFTVGTDFTANASGVYHTGTVNAASHTVGSSLVANATGVYHTGVINAASHTTTGVTANATGVYPTSNSVGNQLGATASRWTVFANTLATTGLMTAGAGLTVTGTANASVAINVGANVNLTTSTINVGNSSVNVVTNSSTVSIGGTVVNSSFFPATANNATYLGGVAAANYLAATVNNTITGLYSFGNTTQSANVTFANGVIIANGSFGSVNYVLSSNGTGMYWADLTVSAVNTRASYVWTNSHTYGNTTQSSNVTISNGNIIFTSPSKLYANGAFGSNNQFLQSNGTAMYWGNGLVVQYANGTQAYP